MEIFQLRHYTSGEMLLPRDLLRTISTVNRAAADGVGRIRILRDNSGLCFDMSYDKVGHCGLNPG